MMILDLIPPWATILFFPVIVLGLWHLLFNSQNSFFTKALVEGGYMLLGIPLMVATFLSIPAMGILFWANSAGVGAEIVASLLVIFVLSIIVVEYFWIKRQIKIIEEREQMSIWQFIKRGTSSEYREARKIEKSENKEAAESFFDEISDMNRKKRELDREEKEKLRRALLGELDSE